MHRRRGCRRQRGRTGTTVRRHRATHTWTARPPYRGIERMGEADQPARVREDCTAALEGRDLTWDVTGTVVADEFVERGLEGVVRHLGDSAGDVGPTKAVARFDGQRDAQAVFDALDDARAALPAVPLDARTFGPEFVGRVDAVAQQVQSRVSVSTRSSIPWSSVTPSRWVAGPSSAGWSRSWSVTATTSTPARLAAAGTSSKESVPSERVVCTCKSATTIRFTQSPAGSRFWSNHESWAHETLVPYTH